MGLQSLCCLAHGLCHTETQLKKKKTVKSSLESIIESWEELGMLILFYIQDFIYVLFIFWEKRLQICLIR